MTPLLALSDRQFQHISDWVGGVLMIVLIGVLMFLDIKVLKSRRTTLLVVVGAVVLALGAGVVVVGRFNRLAN